MDADCSVDRKVLSERGDCGGDLVVASLLGDRGGMKSEWSCFRVCGVMRNADESLLRAERFARRLLNALELRAVPLPSSSDDGMGESE